MKIADGHGNDAPSGQEARWSRHEVNAEREMVLNRKKSYLFTHNLLLSQ